jgi:penicillin-binding protein 1C
MKRTASSSAAFFFSAIFLAVIVAALLAYLVCPKPDLDRFVSYSNAYFDADGELLRLSLSKDERFRVFESLDHISTELINATLLYEDQHFFEHSGVDFIAMARAFWATYIIGDRRIGASTIDMQVARLHWQIPSRTMLGKIQQIIRAIQLTRHFSKEEILALYLNLAPYGRNIEGVAAASLIYFNKRPSELSLPEALTLAVIPQNPNKRNPTTAKGYVNLLTARTLLFERWLEHYPEDASKKKFLTMPLSIRAPEELPFVAPHFVNTINQARSKWEHGYVDTTLKVGKQRLLEKTLRAYVASKSSGGIHNAAALLLNYQTMHIEALVGSADFYNDSIQGQVNGALAKRSPGSALKPFVYALAIDDGLIHPLSLLKDAPRRFGGFTPENYDKRFLGPISVKDALIESRNVPAVTLQSQLKSRSFYQFLRDANIQGLREESFYGLALALGGGEISMVELATLYGALANNGILKPVQWLNKDKSGELAGKNKRVLSAEASFLILDMLKDNPAPNELAIDIASSQKNDLAWKTGTSWAFRDAWAVGVSGPYVAVVWVGNFSGKGNDAFVGRSAAGPLLFSLFASIYPDQGWKVSDTALSGRNLNKPLNLKKIKMCTTTGDLYESNCPSAIESWFIPGVSPIKVSSIYRKIPIDIKSGLRACWHQVGLTELKVYEFWPSDFLQLFRQAGLSLKTPPEFQQQCSIDQQSTTGEMPIITSPQRKLEYVINQASNVLQKIPFTAIVDPDVTSLHWFIDERYQGKTERDQAFFWTAVPGDYQIRVVDDAGRAASKSFVVRGVF